MIIQKQKNIDLSIEIKRLKFIKDNITFKKRKTERKKKSKSIQNILTKSKAMTQNIKLIYKTLRKQNIIKWTRKWVKYLKLKYKNWI